MGLFKDRRHRRAGDLSGTRASHGGEADEHGGHGSDDQLQLDVERVIARELVDAGLDGLVDGVAPVTRARVIEWISLYGYSSFIDSDGDIGGLWHSRLFYFLLFGARTEILQVRGQWNREISIERIEEVLDFCNDWNTDRIWPKAYFRVRDNGMIQVYGEVSVDLEHGATDDQLDRLLACGLGTSAMMFDALDALYPDPAKSAP